MKIEETKKKNGSIILDDDPAMVPVTVLIVLTSGANGALLLRHCIRSLAKNLRGMDADVLVVGTEKPQWLRDDMWLDVADAGDVQNPNSLIMRAATFVNTERIILMTDRMQLLQPVTLADVALLKALPDGPNATVEMLVTKMQGTTKHQVWNYQTNMPVLVFKSAVIQLLDYLLNEKKLTDFHLPTAYFNLVFPYIRPTFVDWRTDGWLLPLVSSKPNIERVKRLFAAKKFLHVGEKSEQEAVSLLKFLTPDVSEAETDVPNEDPTEN